MIMNVAEEKQSKDAPPTQDNPNPDRSGGSSSSSGGTSSSTCDGGRSVTNNNEGQEGSSALPSSRHHPPPPRRLIVDIRQNSYHHYHTEQDEVEEEEVGEGGMEEGRTLTASSEGGRGEERGGSGGSRMHRPQNEGTPTMRKSRSFFSIGAGTPSPRGSGCSGGNGERGTGTPSPRSRLPRLSPRAISMLSPRNLLKKKKQRPKALKTEGEGNETEEGREKGREDRKEGWFDTSIKLLINTRLPLPFLFTSLPPSVPGSAFDGIPSPPALQSQRTKLVCESNSYYR